MDEKLKAFIDNLLWSEKDAVYRYLWTTYVKDDVESYLEERGDIKISPEAIDYAVELYVYDGEYDCNLDYWANIERVVELAYSKYGGLEDEN